MSQKTKKMKNNRVLCVLCFWCRFCTFKCLKSRKNRIMFRSVCFSVCSVILFLKNASNYNVLKCYILWFSRMLAILIVRTANNYLFQNVSNYNCLEIVGKYIAPKMLANTILKLLTFCSWHVSSCKLRKYNYQQFQNIFLIFL